MRQRIGATSPDQVRDATLGAITIGLVPVMGALHEGHVSLMQRSVMENDETVVALIDPTGEPLVFSDREQALMRDAGVRITYKPDPADILPPDLRTIVRVDHLASLWEGERRPGVMDRITTLYAILLNQLQPTRTYVGEKHAQQVAILTQMHEDLALSGEIVPCPTVRDPDGLPLSSDNAALTPDQRAAAIAIPEALFAIQHAVVEGETDASALLSLGNDLLAAHAEIAVEYLAIVDPETFRSVSTITSGCRAIVAATVGEVRLLDNVYLDPGQPDEDPA